MRRGWLWLLPIVALIVIAALVAWLSRPVPPPPATPTIPPTPTVTATVTATRPRSEPPTPFPPTATVVPATMTATTAPPTTTPTPRPTSTPTATAVALRGIARVQAGDTLWSIACRYYDGPLLPGANPLTHCTCWPGIAAHNGIRPPQFIGVGWVIQVPRVCTQ